MPLFHRGSGMTAVGPVLLSLVESIDSGNRAEFVKSVGKAPTEGEIVALLPGDHAEAPRTIATAGHQSRLPGKGVVSVGVFDGDGSAVFMKGELSRDAFDPAVAAHEQAGRTFGLALQVQSSFESDVDRDPAG